MTGHVVPGQGSDQTRSVFHEPSALMHERLAEPLLLEDEHAAKAKQLQPNAIIVERIDLGNGLFDVDPKGTAAAVLSFLNA